jgi:hypothetical protein
MNFLKNLGNSITQSIIPILYIPFVVIAYTILVFGCIVSVIFLSLVYIIIILHDFVDTITQKSN